MHKYFIKVNWIIKRLFPSYIWNLPREDNAVYLSFDDGPDPVVTRWVLDQLRNYNAKATFFCVGENVEKYPELYQSLIDEGHATGNHTYAHKNGWEINDAEYMDDVAAGAKFVHSNLFRPPYGRIRSSQAKQLATVTGLKKVHVIMWEVLSADFDTSFTPEQCLSNVIKNVSAGSIVVFHDSENAFKNLKYSLPLTLEFLKEKGYLMKKIELI
ncbi:MAG: polysaccharide deacetylase family protein [Flavisolibacter sp.]